MNYEKVSKRTEVPENAGVDGFIVALKALLKIPKMQEIRISKDGTVTYTYYKKEGAPDTPLKLDFETVTPAAIVRNVEMQELPVSGSEPAPTVVCRMLHVAHMRHLVPTHFVVSTDSLFWKWHKQHGADLGDRGDVAYGLPVVGDSYIPEESLILCAAHTSAGTLIDTVQTVKAVMLL